MSGLTEQEREALLAGYRGNIVDNEAAVERIVAAREAALAERIATYVERMVMVGAGAGDPRAQFGYDRARGQILNFTRIAREIGGQS